MVTGDRRAADSIARDSPGEKITWLTVNKAVMQQFAHWQEALTHNQLPPPSYTQVRAGGEPGPVGLAGGAHPPPHTPHPPMWLMFPPLSVACFPHRRGREREGGGRERERSAIMMLWKTCTVSVLQTRSQMHPRAVVHYTNRLIGRVQSRHHCFQKLDGEDGMIGGLGGGRKEEKKKQEKKRVARSQQTMFGEEKVPEAGKTTKVGTATWQKHIVWAGDRAPSAGWSQQGSGEGMLWMPSLQGARKHVTPHGSLFVDKPNSRRRAGTCGATRGRRCGSRSLARPSGASPRRIVPGGLATC